MELQKLINELKKNKDDNEIQKVIKELQTHSTNINKDIFYNKDLFNPIKGDDDFVKLVKKEFDFKSPRKYARISWDHLLDTLSNYTRLKQCLAKDISNQDLIFIKDFTLNNHLFYKNEYLIGENLTIFKKNLEFMFNLTGKVNISNIPKYLYVHKEYNAFNNLYRTIKNKGKYKKNILEKFVKGYLGLKKSERANLATNNLARMIKHVYYNNTVLKKKEIEPISQLYILTGAQGVGKTSFITRLFFNNSSQIDSMEDPQLGQKCSKSLILKYDELCSVNSDKENSRIKKYVSEKYYEQNVKYEVQPIDFFARAILVATTNKTNFLTDTTSNAENRRWIFIPFKTADESLGADNETKRILNFYKSLNLPVIHGNYDTTQYFLDMQYTVLFTDEYKNVDIKIHGNEKRVNDLFIKNSMKQTDLYIYLDDLLHKYTITKGLFYKMNSKQRLYSLKIADDITTKLIQNKAKEELQKQYNGNVISIAEVNAIPITSLKQFLDLSNIVYKDINELIETMSVLGYNKKRIMGNNCFVKKHNTH